MWSSPLFWIVVAVAIFWALGAYNRLMRLRSAAIQAFGSFDAHMVRLLAFLGEYGAARAAASSASGAAPVLEALEGAATQLSASLAMARARPLRPDAVAALSAAREVLYTTWRKAEAVLPPEAALRQDGNDGNDGNGDANANGNANANANGNGNGNGDGDGDGSASGSGNGAVREGTPSQRQPGASEGASLRAPALAPSLPPAPAQWQMHWEHHLRQNAQATDVFNDAVLHYNAAIAQFPANLLARVFGFKAARHL